MRGLARVLSPRGDKASREALTLLQDAANYLSDVAGGSGTASGGASPGGGGGGDEGLRAAAAAALAEVVEELEVAKLR